MVHLLLQLSLCCMCAGVDSTDVLAQDLCLGVDCMIPYAQTHGLPSACVSRIPLVLLRGRKTAAAAQLFLRCGGLVSAEEECCCLHSVEPGWHPMHMCICTLHGVPLATMRRLQFARGYRGICCWQVSLLRGSALTCLKCGHGGLLASSLLIS